MKVCRVPGFARRYFSPADLSGWEEGIAYTPPARRRKKAATPEVSRVVVPPNTPEPVKVGESLIRSK